MKKSLFVLGLGVSVLAACASAKDGSSKSEDRLDIGGGGGSALTWPNEDSRANSDGWLVQHHDEIRSMHPRVLVLNFSNNAGAMPKLQTAVGQVIGGLAEGSRYHGYSDGSAAPFLQYEVAKMVDLADVRPDAIGWTHRTSSHYPIKCSTTSWYQFDYQRLLGDEFASLIDWHDEGDGRLLSLGDLVATGRVHEVWINLDGSPDPLDCANGVHMNDFQMPESIELKPKYDANGNRTGGMGPCAGNGCMDASDVAAFEPLGRSLRMVYLNETRGPGCAVHSLGHSFESMANTQSVAYLAQRGNFAHFGNFDLRERYGANFSSWYEVCETSDCLSYPWADAVDYGGRGKAGSFAPLDQGCGNVHFPPNARGGYDDDNAQLVFSTCEHFGMGDGADGRDIATLWSRDDKARYDGLLPDCGGGWQTYWRQSFPGLDNAAHDTTGAPMKNWWPYLFYWCTSKRRETPRLYQRHPRTALIHGKNGMRAVAWAAQGRLGMTTIRSLVVPTVLGLAVLSTNAGCAIAPDTDTEPEPEPTEQTSLALEASPSDILLAMGQGLVSSLVGGQLRNALFPSETVDYDRINALVAGANMDQTVMEQKGNIAGMVQTMHDLDTRRLNGDDKAALYTQIDYQWPDLNKSMSILSQPQIGTKGLGAWIIGVQTKAGMFGELIALDPTRADANKAVLADNLRQQNRFIRESKLALVTGIMTDRVKQVQCTSPSPPSPYYPFVGMDGTTRFGQYADLMACNRGAIAYVNGLIPGVMASEPVQNLAFMDGVVSNLEQVHAAVSKDSFVTVTSATFGNANITGAIGGTCNGLVGCTYPISTLVVGDPAPMGFKPVKITYTCSGSPTPKTFTGLDWSSPVTATLDCSTP